MQQSQVSQFKIKIKLRFPNFYQKCSIVRSPLNLTNNDINIVYSPYLIFPLWLLWLAVRDDFSRQQKEGEEKATETTTTTKRD
jgi:hypothetical protein